MSIISVRVGRDNYAAIKKVCETRNITITTFVREALKDKLIFSMLESPDSWKVKASNLLQLSINQLDYAIRASANFEEAISRLNSKSKIDLSCVTDDKLIGVQISMNNRVFTATVKRQGTLEQQIIAAFFQLEEIMTSDALMLEEDEYED